jgi:hypothetical protein
MTLYNMNDATPQPAGTGRLVLLRLPGRTTTHTHTHLVDVMKHTPDNLYSDGNVYPVYLTGQVPPPINGYSPRFTLTAATPALKRLFFPNFSDSEIGHEYPLGEEPRDPEHP